MKKLVGIPPASGYSRMDMLLLCTSDSVCIVHRRGKGQGQMTLRHTNSLGLFLVLALLAALAAPSRSSAQATSQIEGTITDQTGAVVPSADISLENEETGIRRQTESGEDGSYLFPLLDPGRYRIVVRAEGFNPIGRTGLQLQVAQSATIDFAVSVGTVEEVVNVTETAPLLDTSSNAIGGVVTVEKIDNLPAKGRNPYTFMMLMPGVRITRNTTNSPAISSHWQFFSINGSRPGENAFLLDGGNNSNVGFNSPNYTPQMEAVMELKVQTNNYGAEHANATGGVINVVTKGGTNQFHGSAYEFLRNDKLSANNFFLNRAGRERTALRYNQFGGTVGGPIARNKTFFFFGLESLRIKNPWAFTGTVPTSLQRQGDFSETRDAQAQMIGVFDPLTTREDASNPGAWLRDQFQGNAVPAARFNPVALTASEFYPAPNQAGDANTGNNNYFASRARPNSKNDYSIRADHDLNPETRLMGRYSGSFVNNETPNEFGVGNVASAQNQFFDQEHSSQVVKLTKMFSPSMFGEFVASGNRFNFLRDAIGNDFDVRELGFPGYLADSSRAQGFPRLAPAGMSALGQTRFVQHAYHRAELKANFTKISGNHTWKFGGLAMGAWLNVRLDIFSTGTYSFGAAFTRDDPLRASPSSGLGFATFLLGLPGGTHNPTELHASALNKYVGFYVQDEYRATSRLTLNFGLRYDYETPRTERRNESGNFDFSTPSTLSNGTVINGGVIFPGVDGLPRGHWERDLDNFGPRFGFAYRLANDTVFRGGYGVFFGNSWGSGVNGTGIPQPGFTCSTPVTSSFDGGITPAPGLSLSNPFPDGFCAAPRSSLGLLTDLGVGVRFVGRQHPNPYSQHWNFDIQQRLPGDVLWQVGYAGSRAIDIIGTWEWNTLDPQHMSLGSQLNQRVPNPFFGIIERGGLSGPTITRGQSLRPYPQFTGVSDRDAPNGSGIYHSLVTKIERRFAQGFSVVGSYTWSKNIDDSRASRTGFPGDSFVSGALMNYWNRKGERALAVYDTPHILTAGWVFELPFGAGRRFLDRPGALDKILGGWQLNGTYNYTSGAPLAIGGGNTNGAFTGTRPDWNGQNASLSTNHSKRLDRWFDTSNFSRNEPFTFGNAPRVMPNLRGDSDNSFSISMFKNLKIAERVNLQIRAEAFNAFNRPQFGNPVTSINSTAFGVVRAQSNPPRDVQLALKLLF
ncbi:MAG: TonB-dependent receptor [Bryobacterales bacterium]|nr:TonB-dependent receptor [Bryobacterales bacterium]